MKFTDIYKNSKQAVTDTLTAMWCSEAKNESQQAYAKQLKEVIEDAFAPKNTMPLVQCMDPYKAVHTVSPEEAKKIISPLWKENFTPYEHQYQSWKALQENTPNGEKKSIVVTTGTGSGKTECFMLPLVHNLSQKEHTEQIEAIFLYPLNALMEDQKDRLQNILSSTNLKFAVYNGNTPEREDNDDPHLTELLNKTRELYPNILATRQEMRSTPPNILLTNPSMLEFMLLRNKDQELFTQNSLKWIVIDETHTYTGAGAAELAMLIRRVLEAFGVTADKVRFATSSATIGNGDDDKQKLKKFIAGISGQTEEQIEIIGGERHYEEDSTPIESYRKLLHENDFVRLDELIKEGSSVEDKLEKLDILCNEENKLKAKVHYFFKVLNNGLKVKLTEHKNGCFKIYTEEPINNDKEIDKTPHLELKRCASCGEYVAIGEMLNDEENIYRAPKIIENDMFDLDEEQIHGKTVVFSLSKNTSDIKNQDGNDYVTVNENFLEPINNTEGEWNIVRNLQRKCPHCQAELSKKSDNPDADDEIEEKKLRSFRLSSDFISRIIAPSILPSLKKPEEEKGKPHYGQQYISFVDSRQAAARSTLGQNLEQEKMWVQSRIFHELNDRALKNIGLEGNRVKLIEINQLLNGDIDDAEYGRLSREKGLIESSLANIPDPHLTWSDIYDLLDQDEISNQLCYQFANKTKKSKEINEDGTIKPATKAKYIYTVMLEQLAKRPLYAAAPETMGLFTSYYPLLENIKELPKNVCLFNEQLTEENKISLSDWKDLLKIYLDHSVRSNMSVFLKEEKNNGDIKLDIFECQRFESKKEKRRSVHKPSIKEKSSQYPTVAHLLANLLPRTENQSSSDVIKNNRDTLKPILEDLWNDLTRIGLIEAGQHLNKDGNWEEDKKTEKDGKQADETNDQNISNYRLDVKNIAFKLYEEVALCGVKGKGSKVEKLRPFGTLFKGYTIDSKPVKVVEERKETWQPFPYLFGKKEDGSTVSLEETKDWAKENRKLLWDNQLWGEDGCFFNRLQAIYAYPTIFIQAEHTAQVDKLVAKQSQDDFKANKINILACSTTMEMGVDLGSLELVMMNSVPPHPANFKQRAGRSGRRLDNRSASITLCGADAVGLRTLKDPMKHIIQRPTAIPFVDLQSPQVIQRHVNSFLLRKSKVFFTDNKQENNLDTMLIDFFTDYHFNMDVRTGRCDYTTVMLNQTVIYPDKGLGNKENTEYYKFLSSLDSDDIKLEDVKSLLKNTCYQDKPILSIQNTKKDIENCYTVLTEQFEDIKSGFENANGVDSPNSNIAKFFRHKFCDKLSTNLLTYFATNRFTPNANMPTNIIEFDINMNNLEGSWNNNDSTNPSYVLQDAISQYAPGNTIVLGNLSHIVRGILYTGTFRQTATFKKIYTDGTQTLIDQPNSIIDKKQWPVNGKDALELIEPYAFIPDANENVSRVVEKNVYTQVSAQLIGTDEWINEETKKLFSVRSNRETPNASILYYNEGIGYGYCFCYQCGKAVLEREVATVDNAPGSLPTGMNNLTDNTGNDYHLGIKKKSNAVGNRCGNQNGIKRNVILGGLIQTDYAEIRFLDSLSKEILTTLGIVFCQSFAEYLGKERRDIDFVVMQNNNLCIFDATPGGAGYSNQLANIQTLRLIIDNSLEYLNSIESKNALLDRFTLKYREKLDIKGAIEWLEKERESRNIVPEEISKKYPEAKNAIFEDILQDAKKATDAPVLFLNDNWNTWNYDTEDRNWKNRISELRKDKKDKVEINILVNENNASIPLPIHSVLKRISDWAILRNTDNPLKEEFYPIAYINNRLYFCKNRNIVDASESWGNGDLYCMEYQNGNFGESEINLSENEQTTIKFRIGENPEDPSKIKSNELGEIVYNKARGIIDSFIEYCKTVNKELEIEYLDEHLKSELGILTTLQFINYYTTKIGKEYSLNILVEEYLENREPTSIQNNMKSYYDRNSKLKELCSIATIDTKRARSLPHWRCLSIKCGDKQLDIYPNGGIINGWFLDRDSGGNHNECIVSIDKQIPLFRREQIMYDVEIKEIHV